MIDKVMIIYCSILVLTIVGVKLIYFLVIVPELRKHGAGPLTGCISLSYLDELAGYKEICEKENKQLTWYKTSIILLISTLVLMVGWFLVVMIAQLL